MTFLSADPSTAGRVCLPASRAGAGFFVNAYRRMLAWELASLRIFLPVLGSVLLLQGVGLVLGFGLFFHHIPPVAGLYVTTGGPVLSLLTLGLIFRPQIVAQQRAEGSYDFDLSLPAPRTMSFLAWYTVSLIPAMPAVVLALVVGVARYHLHLDVSALVVPALLLTSLTGTLMGYAVAHGVSSPMTIRLLSIAFIFVCFGFSPILFPASHLPGWLVEVNRWLPFESAATIVRSALVAGYATGVGRAYVVVGSWAALSALVSTWAIGRRP